MRTYTWDEYYEKFYDWAESTRVRNLSYLENLGDSDEVAEIIEELKDSGNAANRLLRRAVEEAFQFSGENLQDLFFWELDKELLIKALKISADRLTTADIEELYITVEDEILLEVCKKAGFLIPEDLQEDFEDEVSEEYVPEVFAVKAQKMSRNEINQTYDYVLQCLARAHEKMVLALKLSIADRNSGKRALSIAKYACLHDAQALIDDAGRALEKIESQVPDKLGVQNIRVNMGNRIVFNDTYILYLTRKPKAD